MIYDFRDLVRLLEYFEIATLFIDSNNRAIFFFYIIYLSVPTNYLRIIGSIEKTNLPFHLYIE